MPIYQRHLPHLWRIGQPLFVTFRLYNSLPVGRAFPKDAMTSGKAFVCMDRLLDEYLESPRYLQVTKTLHRLLPMLYIGVRTLNMCSMLG